MMNLEEAIRIYNMNGGHFFDNDTMDFFGSAIESNLFDNRCFVTSEDNFNRSERYFTVRRFSEDYTKIQTIGKFNNISGYEEAIKMAVAVN